MNVLSSYIYRQYILVEGVGGGGGGGGRLAGIEAANELTLQN